MNKAVKVFLRKLPEGWHHEHRRSGHIALRDPDGRLVTTLPCSPSDHRSLKNAASVIRRHQRARGDL